MRSALERRFYKAVFLFICFDIHEYTYITYSMIYQSARRLLDVHSWHVIIVTYKWRTIY